MALADMMVTAANSTMKAMLRSPLHGLVSNSTMLITLSGRKSGRTYTTPVNYVRDGDTITVLSRKGRVWWKNLRGGAPVTLRIRGQDLTGTAEVVDDDPEAIVRALRALRPRYSPERASERAQDRVVVRIKVG
jgi:deazaflavin-dependent oxidoreductase (nitroreductase family)